MDDLGLWILFDRLRFWPSGRCLDVVSFDALQMMLVRFCFFLWFWERAMAQDGRRDLLFVFVPVLSGCKDEPESLILAQSERWRHA